MSKIVLLQTRWIQHLVFLDEQHDRRPRRGQSLISPASTLAGPPAQAPEVKSRRGNLNSGPNFIRAAVIDNQDLESTGVETLRTE
jgi:hypothetical protein